MVRAVHRSRQALADPAAVGADGDGAASLATAAMDFQVNRELIYLESDEGAPAFQESFFLVIGKVHQIFLSVSQTEEIDTYFIE